MIDDSDNDPQDDRPILNATTELEFCRLLRAVWLRSHLTLGQAKLKTGISRSQIHGLTRKDRSRLPRLRVQVEALTAACGLSPDEVSMVLALWDQLHKSPTSKG